MQDRLETVEISNYKAPRISKQTARNTKVAAQLKNASESKITRFLEKGENWLEFTAPVFTTSEANGGVKRVYKRGGKTCYKSEHWTEKDRRHKLQKGAIALMLRPQKKHLPYPCEITLTRYAPDKLDRFDNLPMSLKWILDAVCAEITGDYRPGRADDYEGIVNVHYKQVISKSYGIKVRVEGIS